MGNFLSKSKRNHKKGNLLSKSKEWSDWLERFENDKPKKAFENIRDSDTYSVLLNLGDEVLKEFIHIGLYYKLAIMLSRNPDVSEELDCETLETYNNICSSFPETKKVLGLMELDYKIKLEYIQTGQYHLFLRQAQKDDKECLQAKRIDISSI